MSDRVLVSEARKLERVLIVRFLRNAALDDEADGSVKDAAYIRAFADAIERGDYLVEEAEDE